MSRNVFKNSTRHFNLRTSTRVSHTYALRDSLRLLILSKKKRERERERERNKKTLIASRGKS